VYVCVYPWDFICIPGFLQIVKAPRPWLIDWLRGWLAGL
jgi:hypothetical protein